MSDTKSDSVSTKKPGRPKSVRAVAEKIIGEAGVKALADADLFIVTGAYLRQGNLFLPPSPPSMEAPLPEEP